MKCLACITKIFTEEFNQHRSTMKFLRLWSWCFYYYKGWWIINVFSRKVLGTKMHINFCTSESCMWSLMGKSSSSWKRRECQHEHITTTNQMKAVNAYGIYKWFLCLCPYLSISKGTDICIHTEWVFLQLRALFYLFFFAWFYNGFGNFFNSLYN